MAEDITRACSGQHKDVTTVSAGLFAAYGAKPTEQTVEATTFHCRYFQIMNRDT